LTSKTQFEALLKIIDQLTHYQLLKIGITASPKEIQDAFHREALNFHPDRYQGIGDPDVHAHAKHVYGKIVEAYRVLSNSNSRAQYDQKTSGAKNAAAAPAADPSDDEITSVRFKRSTPSPVGTKFFKLAQAALQSGNLPSAKMNIQLALNTDPENREFLQLSQRIESGLKKPK
jgi:DnaJ-class molecular chaperone